MQAFRLCVTVIGMVLLTASSMLADESAISDDWLPLFNGKDLSGWTVKIAGHELGDNYGNTFRVEDGLLKVSYDQYEKFDRKFGHLFYKEPLSHYVLQIGRASCRERV